MFDWLPLTDWNPNAGKTRSWSQPSSYEALVSVTPLTPSGLSKAMRFRPGFSTLILPTLSPRWWVCGTWSAKLFLEAFLYLPYLTHLSLSCTPSTSVLAILSLPTSSVSQTPSCIPVVNHCSPSFFIVLFLIPIRRSNP